MQSATVAKEVIRSRVNQNLMAMGFHRSRSARTFYVTYFAGGNITEELQTYRGDRLVPHGMGGEAFTPTDGRSTQLDQHLQGFLVLDFVAAETAVNSLGEPFVRILSRT